MLGLYIHIPFCEKKCAYCDFNTYAGLQEHFAATVDALCLEMARWRAPLHARQIDTIFIGGGTPTVLPDALLGRLFEAIHLNFDIAPGAEITCEANPGTVDRSKFHLLYTLGVNRLSLGVQSFQSEELHFLSRIHSVADVLDAYAAARQVGFANINLDFIFGLPNQPVANWQATLTQALQLAPDHLSLYSLIVEPQTPLHHWVQSGQVPAPDEDLAADHYEMAIEQLGTAGYVHYEVSNWARPSGAGPKDATPAYASQHNLIYWRNQEYLGIGPGAHSHLHLTTASGKKQPTRWGNRKPVPGYTKRIQDGRSVEESSEAIDPRMSMGETMMLGLRLLREGVTFPRFYQQHGRQMQQIFASELAQLQSQQLLAMTTDAVRLTDRGLFLGNQVFAQFLP